MGRTPLALNTGGHGFPGSAIWVSGTCDTPSLASRPEGVLVPGPKGSLALPGVGDNKQRLVFCSVDISLGS